MKKHDTPRPAQGQLRRMYERMEEIGLSEADLARRLYGPETPQARVNNWKRRGRIPDSELPRIAEVLEMPFEELYYGSERLATLVSESGSIKYLYRSKAPRYIPLLTYEEAANWQDALGLAIEEEGRTMLRVDADMAARLGPTSFALDVKGDAMVPDFKPSDRVVIDPEEPVMPGDIVAGKDEHGQVVLRKYRSRGRHADGRSVFQLAPLNDDYPLLEFHGAPDDQVIGPVIEHRRYFRQP